MTEVERHRCGNSGKSYSPMTGQSWFRESVAELIVCGLLVCVTPLSAGSGWMFSIRDRKWAPHLMTHMPHPNSDGSPLLLSPLLSLSNMLFLSFEEMKNILRAKGVSFYDMIMSSCIQLDPWTQAVGLRSAGALRFGRKRRTSNSEFKGNVQQKWQFNLLSVMVLQTQGCSVEHKKRIFLKHIHSFAFQFKKDAKHHKIWKK